MVHFPGLSSPPYGFRWRYSGINLSGLPHSDILGSKPVCGSPKLFAAYHVLHRLLAPRHSPHALSSLTIRNSKLTPIAGSRVRQLAGSNVPNREPASRETRHAIAPCTLRVPASTLTGVGGYNVQPSPQTGAGGTLWSEKTTVCRIFSCKRTGCSKLPASSSGAASSRERRMRGELHSKRLARAPLRQDYRARSVSLARTCYSHTTRWRLQAEPIRILLAVCTVERYLLTPLHLRWLASSSGGQPSRGLPAVGSFAYFSGPPSPRLRRASLRVFMSEGWWRIPGSNR
jgi:hypothetical protein